MISKLRPAFILHEDQLPKHSHLCEWEVLNKLLITVYRESIMGN